MLEPIEMADERHNTDAGALDCWCDPRYLACCDECNSQDKNCWRCAGEKIPITRDEAQSLKDEFGSESGITIVHKEDRIA